MNPPDILTVSWKHESRSAYQGDFVLKKRGEENEQKEDTNGGVDAAVQLFCGDFRNLHIRLL